MTSKSNAPSYKDTAQSNISIVESGIVAGTSDSSTSNSNNGTVKQITKGDGGTTRRAPPLKATTANPATTTLVSSGEQQIVVLKGTTTLMTPATPRIELSRASSSSHQEEDSRESSPENVFDQVGTGTLQETIEIGFREEGTLELRSSTEELFFMDPVQKKEEQEKIQQQQTKRPSPHIFKFEDHQNYLQQHQRKDSASSEVAALLCISGRSSRISSVGSQGSAVSHLSAISGVSRSPSPHRMLLETSFCGPKPLQNVVDGRVVTTVEAPAAELLEQMLLSRKHDPTQVILAEGIKVENSPKKKPTSLSNGDPAIAAKIIATQNQPAAVKTIVMGAQRRSTKSPGQMVVGKTPSGTEYIRINLKPDHMYDDKGIAPHERVVEAPNTLMPVYARGQKKPGTLSLGNRNAAAIDENRLTPTASPKPSRHGAVPKDAVGSRSPSPATTSVSRKSSFSSIFRLGGKDSPDSPRDRSRPRSKSKDRQKPQSQNATPSKQKSVLAIFTTGKRGSSAGNEAKSPKTSSPSDGHDIQRSRQTPVPIMTATGSRPPSRLRYYDEPVEGYIHIPLHTPPEEKETRKLLDNIQQLNAEPPQQATAAITPGQLAAAAAALKPVGTRKGSGSGATHPTPPPPPPKPQSQKMNEKVKRAENLDAIHTLPHDDDGNKDRSWSLEVNRHSSQDSQETAGSDCSFASAIRAAARSHLSKVKENISQENGTIEEASAEVHRLPSVDSTTSAGEPKVVETVATINETHIMAQQKDLAAAAKEKRRMLFATRLGSGSQEQVFTTQFSISKTESQSSQLSEKAQRSEKTIFESSEADNLQRQSTIVRRTDSEGNSVKHLDSTEVAIQGTKSISTSEDEKSIVRTTTVSAVVIRRKESSDELRQKSTSDDDANLVNTQRHSRYLENFDVRKKYQDNLSRKPKRQSTIDSGKLDSDVEAMESEVSSLELRGRPTLPQPPPPSSAPSPSPSPKAASYSRSPTPPTGARRSQSQSPVERARQQTPTKPPRTTTPTRRTQQTPTASPPSVAAKSMLKKPLQSDRQSNLSTDEPVESSESERDSELTAGTKSDAGRHHLPRHVGVIEDHESTGLVSQESFDDDLPYIPTTLPEERAHGVSLIPMKERANMELKTCPVDRPRSTTPLNPSHLEEYYGITTPQEPNREPSRSTPVRGEKLRISLPRRDSANNKPPQNSKSPRRASTTSGKTWFEFAEEGLRATSGNLERRDSNKQLLQKQQQPQKVTTPLRATAAKTLPSGRAPTTTTVQSTRGGTTTTQRKLSGHWIDFENIPEKRKPPKRITTLPKDTLASSSRSHQASAQQTQHPMQVDEQIISPGGEICKVIYNFVNPEDCQCECHDAERESSGATMAGGTTASGEKLPPNAEQLRQGEDCLPLLDSETIHDLIEPSDSSREYSYYTDDEMDVPMHHSGSSRSKNSSLQMDEFPRRDKSPISPRNKRFPDYRKK